MACVYAAVRQPCVRVSAAESTNIVTSQAPAAFKQHGLWVHHRVLQRQLRCRKLLAGLREALKLLDEERPGPEGDVLRMITNGPCSQPFSRMSSFFLS